MIAPVTPLWIVRVLVLVAFLKIIEPAEDEAVPRVNDEADEKVAVVDEIVPTKATDLSFDILIASVGAPAPSAVTKNTILHGISLFHVVPSISNCISEEIA